MRKIDALLDSPWTGNQIKKWSLSANPTALTEEVKDTHVQQGTVHHTDTKTVQYSNQTLEKHIYLKNCAV